MTSATSARANVELSRRLRHSAGMTKIETAQRTERRASRRMIYFVLALAALAAAVTLIYLLGFHPGATTSI